MKRFLAKNWTLILVAIYIIFPDLFPGPIDDIALLVAERTFTTIVNQIKLKKKTRDAKKK